MNKYLISNMLFLTIVEGKTPIDAWAKYVTENSRKQENIFWDKEYARQQIEKMGYKGVRTTELKNVFKIF